METSSQRSRKLVARNVTAPTDIASLAAFRFLLGLMMTVAMVRFIANGWVTQFYIEPHFFFSYPGFEWIHPWPGGWMYVHFALLALLAVGVALGFHYRICITFFALGFTYVELIDQTTYLNHYYLISLLSWLLVFLPANRAWSLDARRKPGFGADTLPAWCLNVLRFQIAAVYIFAGLAKFNSDWLFHAQPLRIWLAARSDLPLVGPWLSEPWIAFVASWFGAFFDTGIVFLFLWKRTRRMAYVLIILFHAATWILFNIGMFPWIMIAAATLLLPADWPRHWLQQVSKFLTSMRRDFLASATNALLSPRPTQAPDRCTNRFVVTALAVYVLVQLALPLRSYFETQPPAWTCSGFNCAWRVMIVEKTGYASFHAFDPVSGRTWEVPLRNYITPRQETLMAQDPYLIREMARRIAEDFKMRGYANVQIKVTADATLNGRPSQPLISPQANLATTSGHDWIVPLQN